MEQRPTYRALFVALDITLSPMGATRLGYSNKEGCMIKSLGMTLAVVATLAVVPAALACEVAQFGRSPKALVCPTELCQGAAVEEVRHIKNGALFHQGAFLAGTGKTVAVDFDRLEVVRVDTYIGDGMVKPPETVPVGSVIRREGRGQREDTYVIRVRKLTEAQVEVVGCSLDRFWEWTPPVGWTPPMPTADGQHMVRLMANGRAREFSYFGEPVGPTTAIIEQVVDPAWGP
jgi:hypothetical protein